MQTIDRNHWERNEIFTFFSRFEYPFYSVTIPVDVTPVRQFARENQVSFYHMMIWLCTKAVNRVPAFRMRVRGEEVVLLDRTDPSFTAMRRGESLFRIITLPWEASPLAFCTHACRADAAQDVFIKENDTDSLIYFSCTPWFDFTALTNEHALDKDDTVPRLAWGRWYEEKGRWWVHLSVEVNHRLVDGLHIGQMKEALDAEIAALAQRPGVV